MTKEKAYCRFKVRVGVSNPAKLTAEILGLIKEALESDPEIVNIEIKEDYQ